jgi:hypothetical protein
MKIFNNLKYLQRCLRYKYLAFLMGPKLGISLKDLFFHMNSVFRPDEWIVNVRSLDSKVLTDLERKQLAEVSLKHVKRNLFYYENWGMLDVGNEEVSIVYTSDFSFEFLQEDKIRLQVLSWAINSYLKTGRWNSISKWYEQRRNRFIFDDDVRCLIEDLIEDIIYDRWDRKDEAFYEHMEEMESLYRKDISKCH